MADVDGRPHALYPLGTDNTQDTRKILDDLDGSKIVLVKHHMN